MAINRRQFLKRTGLATAGAFFGPNLFGSPFVRRAMADGFDDAGRYLILLFLDGGNDGLNTVVPMSDATGNLRAAYELARTDGEGGLRITIPELTPTAFGTCPLTNTAIGLHPGLIGLKNLQTEYNSVAVIQNCGYPNPNLSHEESRNIWQTASPLAPANNGWIGAHLAAAYGSSDIPGVCISGSVGRDFQQTGTNVLAVSDLQNFRFPYKSGANSSERAALKAAYQAMYGPAALSLQGIHSHVGTVGSVTLDAADNYPPLSDAWDADRAQAIRDSYDALTDNGNGTADRLRDISRIIYGVENDATGISSRFFRLGADGGFDTHSDQGGATGYHHDVHRNWSDAVEVFYRDMVDMGVANRVLLMVWSEFSRRIQQNDTGTDHGSQGPMFIVGGSVNGGVYGSHANINDDGILGTLEDGNTVYTQAGGAYRTTDFRDVYGTVLQNWVNMPLGTVQALLPADPIMSQYYWNTRDFGLGFL